MFGQIIEYYKKHPHFSAEVENNIVAIARYYVSISEQTRSVLSRIKDKYQYSKRNNFVLDLHLDTHLEFWRGSGDFNIAVFLADNTGTYDRDPEFGCFIEETTYSGHVEIENYDELTLYYMIYENLFHAWLAFLWQEVGGNETGMVVKILESNSAACFCLNDFAWDDLSDYLYFRDTVSETPKYFNRDLSFEEIYSRADLRYSYSKIPVRERIYSGHNLKIKVSLLPTQIKIENLSFNKILSIEVLNGSDKQNQQKYIKKMNTYLKGEWNDVTFSI
ncbi:MAG: hypothetical protein K0S32_1786 [Bacteroidetes bacterium]|nr:hypothetical protein [Bacteroidota bacterium]